MSSRDERIAKLEAQIEALEAERRAATTPDERKDLLLEAITAKEKRLTELIRTSAPAAAAGADAIDELRKKVDELVYLERLKGDHRLFYFGLAAPSSSGRHTQADTFIDLCYQGTCVLCGSKEDVSRAHLVSGSHKTTYQEFGPPNYSDTLNVKSSRNFIPLCGTKGKRSTCHDAFDTFRLTILWNPLGAHYYCFCLDRGFEKYGALHLKPVSFHEDHKPYNRLLAWHTRKCAIEHSYWVSGDDVSNLLCAVDMSETMSTGHEDSSRSSSAAAV